MAIAASGLGLGLVLVVTLARRPFPGLSAPFVLGAAALAFLAVWTLVSAVWSQSPARALVEYDLVLLYLLAYLVLGALGRSPTRLRWLIRGVAVGAFVVCAAGLATRLAPDVWSIGPSVAADRLSFPLTYWNALGLLAAVGMILCFALTSDAREAGAGRVLAAGALPVLSVTLLLTFSRGSIAAGAVGLAAVVLVGRPRALLSGLLVVVPTVGVAVVSAYGADLLATADPTTAAAAVQGRHVALVVALCVAAALLARMLLLLLDRRMARITPPAAWRSTRVRWATGIGALAVVAVVVVALGAPQAAERRYARFVQGDAIQNTDGDSRKRLTDSGNNGRLAHWRVAVSDFRANPVRGRGAGTFALSWEQNRATAFQVENAHSLYLEVLGELGAVGLVLLLVTLLLILGGFLRCARGPDRVVGAALFGAASAWALHAGIDWDWEMPAVTLWIFAAGGLALSAAPAPAGEKPDGAAVAASQGSSADEAAASEAAAPKAAAPKAGPPRLVRVLAGLGCLLLLLAPLSVLRSEGPLRDAQDALARGDCGTAVDRALDAKAALSVRPEPSFVLGVCDVRLGFSELAVRALQDAVARDPDNWEYRYGTALVRGAAGLDPRPAARAALRLNPGSSLAGEAVRRFDTSDPAKWKRRALQARLPGGAD
ncbi:MAG: O-antigen ligase family protein [Actinomycetota bacterium]|nr:O-antigen ligase family protein [Actinomycetota bacterium]